MSAPSRLDTMRTLRNANLDVAFATAFVTLFSGTFLIGFVRYLGGSDLWVGVVSAIPSLMGLMQIPGGILGRRAATYKRFIRPIGFTWRAIHIPIAILPLLPWPDELRLSVLALCIGLAWAFGQLNGPLYNDWIAELVPMGSRGAYLSQRTIISNLTGVTVGIGAALLLDRFVQAGLDTTGFAVVFAIGILCAALSQLYFERMHDTERVHIVRTGLRESIRSMARPLADRNFRYVLLFAAVFVTSQTFAGGLFFAYAFETLGLGFFALQLTQVAMSIGIVALARTWGFLADKYGNKPVLAMLMVGVIVSPLPWVFTIPGRDLYNIVILLIGHGLAGLVWGGVAVCQINLYYATATPEERPNYLGVALTLQSLIGAAAPLAGAAMMNALRNSLSGPEAVEHAYKLVFVTVVGIRLIAALLLIPIKEESSVSLKTALSQLRRVTPGNLRALREIQRSTDPSERERAIQRLGTGKLGLASSNLAQALHDPSPVIRRQAATALANMRDPEATAALLRFVEENPTLIEEETLEALSLTHSPRVSDVLIGFLDDPRSMLRRGAAKALARAGDERAGPALIRAAQDPNDPDLCRAALQGLRRIGDTSCSEVVANALLSSHPSVRIAAAEAAVFLRLPETVDALRGSLYNYPDDASSEVAYALGFLGETNDLSLLLDHAGRMTTPAARRRCLLGIARLLSVEPQVYAWLTNEGLSRDLQLQRAAKQVRRRVPKLAQAFESLSHGQEAEAWHLLREFWPLAQTLEESEVEESILVALAAALHSSGSA